MSPFDFLALMVLLVALAMYVIVTVDAFDDETVRGIYCLVFPPYAYWYALKKFDHPHRSTIVGTMIVATFFSAGIYQAGIMIEERARQTTVVYQP